ncbi:MAG TPA: tail fiber domain-containing protein [Candidatus Saccharimonadia bacterium]|nr:tail fiber domain-containing protein [Candidatus Saccharimonadia bacterium]
MRAKISHVPRAVLFAVACLAAIPAAAAPFVYRGALSDRGEPAEGAYAFRLTFHDAQQGGSVIGHPLTLEGVAVSNGTFEAALELDPALERRESLWMAVEVRDANGAFVQLAEREAVLPKGAVGGLCWDTTGNTGHVAGVNFLGHVDDVVLDLRANNARALRIDPNTDAGYGSVPNIVGGASTNAVLGGFGVTIAGGGSTSLPPPLPGCSGICGNQALGNFATIGGGNINRAAGVSTTVAGGERNIATGDFAVIGGGRINNLSGDNATIGGGAVNDAVGDNATIGGGSTNSARGVGATVPGGFANQAGGDYSFVAGQNGAVRNALATQTPEGDRGTFVWSDTSSNSVFESTGSNQFLARASGGFAINTTTIANSDDLVIAARPLNFGDSDADLVFRTRSNARGAIYMRNSDTGLVATGFASFAFGSFPLAGRYINTGANGAHLTTDGIWTNGSSREFKEAFAAIDPLAILDKVLELPLSTWRYKNSEHEQHLGPMAEDFAAAFGLGGSTAHIGTLDADGVALAAIQGLNAKLERENRELRERLERIERRLGGALAEE